MCSRLALLMGEGTSSQTTSSSPQTMVTAAPAKKVTPKKRPTAAPAKKMVPKRKLQIG